MIPLFLKLLWPNKIKGPLARLFVSVFMFIACILLLCLALSCHSSTAALSDVYLVEAISASNSTITRTGYFKICSKAASNGTLACGSLSSFENTGGAAYTFAKHISRPYFISVTLALSCLGVVQSILRMFFQRFTEAYIIYLFVLFIFCLVTAVWQQVAVHAATRLMPGSVKSGTRAGAMVWVSFTFIILTLVLELFVLRPEESSDDTKTDPESSVADSVMSTIYKVEENPFRV